VNTDACGTYAGFQRHRKAGVAPCDGCLAASAAYQVEYRRRRSAAATERAARTQRVRRRAIAVLVRRHRKELAAIVAEINKRSGT